MGCFVSINEDEVYFFNNNIVTQRLLVVTTLEKLIIDLHDKIDEINKYSVCIVTLIVVGCDNYTLSFDSHDTREKMDKWIDLIMNLHSGYKN